MTEPRDRRYRARVAEGAADLRAVQSLRHAAFVAGTGARARDGGLDSDAFDALCTHVMVEDIVTGALVACFRVLPLRSGAEIGRSYSAQYYTLDAFADYTAPMTELGRFCVAPGSADPDILRTAWGWLTTHVDAGGVGMLFGCSSFRGTDRRKYADAFAMLRDNHLAPRRWLPRVKAPDVFRFARALKRVPDRARALKTMPPLLRSYLGLGGWVSDHAVVDRDLNTLHVFTGLEICAIPPGRARVMRAAAGA